MVTRERSERSLHASPELMWTKKAHLPFTSAVTMVIKPTHPLAHHFINNCRIDIVVKFPILLPGQHYRTVCQSVGELERVCTKAPSLPLKRKISCC
ncbi:hypothetical protein TNIN_59141 [Trichonephila inaurata madagascariensis]|uniref:Uncharacterized protein n=1 Tax=Trichonephila inaurata madagascariensis TaxID=2747483 RepID=A0A8X6IWE3_9ARAC|nr:hypothetical protein TNIN_59141 [Trichonephila inaurata madagascariensis]